MQRGMVNPGFLAPYGPMLDQNVVPLMAAQVPQMQLGQLGRSSLGAQMPMQDLMRMMQGQGQGAAPGAGLLGNAAGLREAGQGAGLLGDAVLGRRTKAGSRAGGLLGAGGWWERNFGPPTHSYGMGTADPSYALYSQGVW